jgi:hypothetical protein
MADNIQTPSQTSAPAPQTAPAPAPMQTNSFKQPDGVYTPEDIFTEFSQKLGLGSDLEQDFSNTKQYDDRSIQDLYDQMGEPKQENSGETENSEDSSNMQGTELKPEQVQPEKDFSYEYNGKIGDEEKQIQFKNKEQLDRAISKALVADKIYKQHKELQARIPELEASHAYAQRIDEMIEKEPLNLLDTIMEDMDEETVKDWLIAKADHYSRPSKEREIERKLKHADLLQRKLEAVEQREAELEQRRIESAREADRHTVQSWGDGLMSKVRTRIPEEYFPMMKDVLQSTLLEGKNRRNNNENVTIKTLDSIFARRAKPIIELIGLAKKSASGKTVQAEVGRAIDSKKQDGLNRIQQATSSMNQKQAGTKPNREFNVSEVFDDLIEGVGTGRYRMRN